VRELEDECNAGPAGQQGKKIRPNRQNQFVPSTERTGRETRDRRLRIYTEEDHVVETDGIVLCRVFDGCREGGGLRGERAGVPKAAADVVGRDGDVVWIEDVNARFRWC